MKAVVEALAGTVRLMLTGVPRSDGVPTRSGSVGCLVRADGERVVATGRYANGRATHRAEEARRVSGSMTVRADGVASTVPFSYRVR